MYHDDWIDIDGRNSSGNLVNADQESRGASDYEYKHVPRTYEQIYQDELRESRLSWRRLQDDRQRLLEQRDRAQAELESINYYLASNHQKMLEELEWIAKLKRKYGYE